ncbi:MAG: hypothetical protein GEU82_11375, partial [Luteitalea sp.]|nr:hypothetical protein [Luteitalea sp.]
MPRLFVTADVGGPAHYHLGDEAMLEANLRMFRQLVPGIEFIVPSRDPVWTAHRYGVEGLPSPHLREAERGIGQRIQAQSADAATGPGMWAEWLGAETAQRVRD